MQCRQWSAFLAVIAIFSVSSKLTATAIFSGSFVNLSVDLPEKSVSINYPRHGKRGICGVEIKSNVIVLNRDVWRKLADVIEVREFHDDQFLSVVPPSIGSEYSPTLRYVFSRFDSQYGSLVFSSKNGHTLRGVANTVLGGKFGEAGLIAVAYSCSLDFLP